MVPNLMFNSILFGTLLALGVACSKPTPERSAQPKPSATVHASALPSAPSKTPPPAPTCDGHSLWFDSNWGGTPEQNQASFVSVVKSWSADCRMKAVELECGYCCDDFITAMLIQGGSNVAAQRSLLRVRYDRNLACSSRAEEVFAKVKEITRYARSLIGSPRSSAYRNQNESLEDKAAHLVDGDPCIERMKREFERIRVLNSEVTSNLPKLPQGFVGLSSTLSFTQNCLNCADDRSPCEDMTQDLTTPAKILASHKKLVANDKRVLALPLDKFAPPASIDL